MGRLMDALRRRGSWLDLQLPPHAQARPCTHSPSAACTSVALGGRAMQMQHVTLAAAALPPPPPALMVASTAPPGCTSSAMDLSSATTCPKASRAEGSCSQHRCISASYRGSQGPAALPPGRSAAGGTGGRSPRATLSVICASAGREERSVSELKL